VEGKAVAVSGVGMLGVIACAMCKVGGAKRIIALDIHQKRLETAQLFGAHETSQIGAVKDLLSRHEASVDILFEFSGVAEAMESTLPLLGIGGTVVWIGATHPQRKVCIDAESIVRRLLTLKGLHNYNGHDLRTAVEFIEKHYAAFAFEQLIDDRFSLEQVREAFQYAMESGVYRVGVEIEESQ
jgi:threonine dehydrogenase-like Zn-dependent dehydrogenase